MPIRPLLLSLPFLLFALAHANAAFIYNGGSYLQDFNSLPSTGGPISWNNDSTIAGWFSSQATYSTDNGSSTAANQYSYGSTGNSDRAFGSLTTNSTPQIQFALQMQNATGQTITQFTLTFTGEQWRGGGQARQNFLDFDYRLDATSGINAAAGTTVSQLRFGSLQTLGTLDGNLAANRTILSQTVTGLTWNAGEYLTLRWTDNKLAGANHGLGIDDLTFTTNVAAVPEPSILFGLTLVPIWRLSRRRSK